MALLSFALSSPALGQGSFFKPEPPPKKGDHPRKPVNGKPAKPQTEGTDRIVASPSVQSGGTNTGGGQNSVVAGPVASVVDMATLMIGAKQVKLFGIEQQEASDEFKQGFMRWLDRNGGRVLCKPSAAIDYICTTSSGIDLGFVFAANGSKPGEFAPQNYLVIANAVSQRLAAQNDPVIAKVIAGDIVMDCHNPLGCGARLSFGGFDKDNALFADYDWVGLAKNVVRIGFQSDIQYYYLGRVAEELGAFDAAIKYLRRAAELHASDDLNDRCATLSEKICNGIDLDTEIDRRIGTAEDLRRYVF